MAKEELKRAELQTKTLFFDPELRKLSCSKGGKVQGKINFQTGHLKKIAQQYWNDVKQGKRDGRPKRIWIHSKELNKNKMIFASEPMPTGFEEGRIVNWLFTRWKDK